MTKQEKADQMADLAARKIRIEALRLDAEAFIIERTEREEGYNLEPCVYCGSFNCGALTGSEYCGDITPI